LSGESCLESGRLVLKIVPFLPGEAQNPHQFHPIPQLFKPVRVGVRALGLRLFSTPTTNPAPRVPPVRRLRGSIVIRSHLLTQFAYPCCARSARERLSVTLWIHYVLVVDVFDATRSRQGISPTLCPVC
jgi:hypothetical protein